MVWMGSQSNIAAITGLDITGLEDNIIFAAVAELRFLLLQKTSTATVDNATVWAASPSGRWHLTGGSGGGGGSSIEVVANLAALQALASASQDKLYALDTTPPQLFAWDAASTATVSADIVKLTALTNGRMYKIYPAAGGGGSSVPAALANIAAITALNDATLPDWCRIYAIAEKKYLILDKNGSSSDANNIFTWATLSTYGHWILAPGSVIISSDPPPSYPSAMSGTTWIWGESGYKNDRSLRVITYVYANDPDSINNWQEISARTRMGVGDPRDLGINPMSLLERWVNTSNNDYFVPYFDEYGSGWIRFVKTL